MKFFSNAIYASLMIQQALAASNTGSSNSYLILGPNIQNSLGKYQLEGVKVIGDGKKTINNNELDLKDNALVKINAHGNYNDVHGYVLSLFSHTYSLRNWSHEYVTQPINIELFSCHGGGAIRDLDAMPFGSTIIATVGHENSVWADVGDRLLAESFNFAKPDNPFAEFAAYIFTNPDGNYFAVNLGLIPSSQHISSYNPFAREEFVNTFSQPGKWASYGIFISPIKDLLDSRDLSIEAIKKWQNARLDEFIKFAEGIKHKVPPAMQEQIEEFKEMVVTQEWGKRFNADQFQQTLSAVAMNHGVGSERVELLSSVHQKDLDLKMTSLQRAVSGGNIEFVKGLIDKGYNINEIGDDGGTLLHKAAIAAYGMDADKKADLMKMLSFLVAEGLDVKAVDKNGLTPLHLAALSGFHESISFFVNNGADVNAANSKGMTPLHLAASDKFLTANELIKNGANVKALDNSGWTPLHYAVVGIEEGSRITSDIQSREDKLKMINNLLEAGADANAADGDGMPVLHVAVGLGHADFVEALVEKKADVNIVDANGESALRKAIKAGRVEMAKTFIKNGADVIREFKKNDFLSAINEISDAELMRLIRDGVNAVDANGESALRKTIKGGHAEEIKTLIKAEADIVKELKDNDSALLIEKMNDPKLMELIRENINAVDGNGDNALHVAVRDGEVDFMNALIKMGVDVNAVNGKGLTPLGEAVSKEDIETTKVLLEAGAKYVDNDRNTPLHIAARDGGFDFMNALIKMGVDVNAVNSRGVTPVYLAAYQGHVEAVELLIDAGANVNIADDRGNTPLHSTIMWSNRIKMVKALLKVADVEMVDNEGRTVLRLAAARGNVDAVKAIVERGVDVNAANGEGMTALHLAAKGSIIETAQSYNLENERMKYAEVIKTLVGNGANVDAVNDKEETPLHIAVSKGHIKTIEVLIGAGADVNAVDKDGTSVLRLATDVRIRRQSYIKPSELGNEGYANIVKILAENGADVNAVNKYKESALTGAARSGNVDAIRVLFEAGADIQAEVARKGYFINLLNNIPNADKFAAKKLVLHEAASQGCVEAVKAMIIGDVDINCVDENGDSALHKAARYGHVAVIELLARAGANPNIFNSKGWSPLGEAAGEGQVGAIEALIKVGTNIKAGDNDERSALHEAVQCDQTKAAKVLIKAGAEINPVLDSILEKNNTELMKFILDNKRDKLLHGERIKLQKALDNSEKRSI